MVFIKKSNVWIARDDGSRQVRLTRDGTRRRPYFSPTVADNGTIVALKGIHLYSFKPNGRRIVRPRQWAINPSPSLSTEPFSVDLSPNGRIVATHNGIYSTYYDPRTSDIRPTLAAQFVDFFDFRKNKEVGKTDGYYDYGAPSWIDSRHVLTTSYGIFNAQVLIAEVGDRTSGADYFRDPNRDPATGTNAFVIADAEATRARDSSRSCADRCRAPTPPTSASPRSRSTAPAIPRPPRRRCARSAPAAASTTTRDPSWSTDGTHAAVVGARQGDLLDAGHRRAGVRARRRGGSSAGRCRPT